MPEKSEVRKRLEASVLPVCPECGLKNTEAYTYTHLRLDPVYGFVPEQSKAVMDDTFRCRDCKAIFHTEELEGCEGCDQNEDCGKEECDN